VLLPCTIMFNNIEPKRERVRENGETNLCDSKMCLRPQKYDYISLYDLGFQHNIFIRKP
jgi:hypothetical protein